MTRDTVFYDGECGLCHRTVCFLLARDSAGERFAYAPLAGSTFAAQVDSSVRRNLPDSIVVRTAEGRLLLRASAALYLLEKLGGPWHIVGRVLSVVPRSWLDRVYDGVARVRRRLFARPPGACPIVPEELRRRFLP